MGLFDGQLGGDGFASTAHVATVLRAPLVLVLDISSVSRTAAAIVHGLHTYDPAVRLAGVILNKSGSARHAAEVTAALETTGLPVLGVLPRDAGVEVPSRHLGLVTAAEQPAAAETVRRLGARVAEHLDLTALLALAHTAPPIDAEPWDPGASRPVSGGGEPSPDTSTRGRQRPGAGGGDRRWAGVHLPLRRDRRTAASCRLRAGRVRSVARSGAAVGHRRSVSGRRIPGGPRRGTQRQHRPAGRHRRRDRRRTADRRRVRGPPLSVRERRRHAHGRRRPRPGDDERAPHPWLPERRRRSRPVARPGGHPGPRTRVPPHGAHSPRSVRLGLAARHPRRVRGRNAARLLPPRALGGPPRGRPELRDSCARLRGEAGQLEARLGCCEPARARPRPPRRRRDRRGAGRPRRERTRGSPAALARRHDPGDHRRPRRVPESDRRRPGHRCRPPVWSPPLRPSRPRKVVADDNDTPSPVVIRAHFPGR